MWVLLYYILFTYRYMVAARDLEPGDIILKEKATVHGPNLEGSKPLCVVCYALLHPGNFVPCPKCQVPLCSLACGNKESHKAECHILSKCPKGFYKYESIIIYQWLAVSYRILFFSIEESIGTIFKVSVSYRENNQNFNPVPILLDQYYVCPSLYDQTTQTSFVHALGTVTLYKLFFGRTSVFFAARRAHFFAARVSKKYWYRIGYFFEKSIENCIGYKFWAKYRYRNGYFFQSIVMVTVICEQKLYDSDSLSITRNLMGLPKYILCFYFSKFSRGRLLKQSKPSLEHANFQILSPLRTLMLKKTDLTKYRNFMALESHWESRWQFRIKNPFAFLLNKGEPTLTSNSFKQVLSKF